VDKKKPQSCQRFRETVIVPEANDADASVLELDELWSFVMKKTNQAWILSTLATNCANGTRVNH
jgi:insertion element IS1 protein InsB